MMKRMLGILLRNWPMFLPLLALVLWMAVGVRKNVAAVKADNLLAGWLIFLLLLATWAVIITFATDRRYSHNWRWMTGRLAVLCLVVGVAMAGPWLVWGTIDTVVAGRLISLLIAWMVLCAGITLLFRRLLGSALAVVTGLLIAAFLIFLPIAAVPFFSVMAGRDSHWLFIGLVNSCPSIWLLHALPPQVHYDWVTWFHQHFMYRLTTLGQSVVMPRLMHWWMADLLAFGMGLLCGGTEFLGCNNNKQFHFSAANRGRNDESGENDEN